ncbi:MAG: Cys-Gln thioester bond-forming surface protein [Coriobacteriales bacterium]|jgi:hypothetical protein|nr:Cys-Gln thioester bond-forming surface protein [Coriobacteriales bacterium]
MNTQTYQPASQARLAEASFLSFSRLARGIIATTIALLLALVCLTLSAPRAEAADPETEPFTAVVKYYDSIQMKYVVQHGIDEFWTTTGDIPIGGFVNNSGLQLMDQAYCVDATVIFHSSPETQHSWPSGVTTDTTPGYVVASPLALSDNVRANLPSLYWLTINGFNGDRNGVNNLAAIRSRYAALETKYGTPIDTTIAIMATKAAVWRYTDPTFALLSTSLTPDPSNPTPAQKARYELMIELMRDLVNDARIEGATITNTTTLDVDLDNSGADYITTYPGYVYYGPITVNEKVNNGTAGTPQQVYLTASGMYASDISYYTAPMMPPLNSTTTIYGTNTTAPYVANNGSFYLRVDDDSDALIWSQGKPEFRYLALHGFGKAEAVEYQGTPAIMTWQGPVGQQEWGHVQAFIGLINNMQASLYGEGSLFIQGQNDNCTIRVNKAVLGATDLVDAGSFVLTLEARDNALQTWVPVPLIPGNPPDGNITGSTSVVINASPSGVFSLADGDTVTVSGLPVGDYRVSEQTSVDGYSAVHQVSTNPTEPGFDAEMTLNYLVGSRDVAFTNTILPKPPTPPGPVPPGPTPKPDVPAVPQTGDGSGLPLLAFAAVLVAGSAALLLRRYLLRRHQ